MNIFYKLIYKSVLIFSQLTESMEIPFLILHFPISNLHPVVRKTYQCKNNHKANCTNNYHFVWYTHWYIKCCGCTYNSQNGHGKKDKYSFRISSSSACKLGNALPINIQVIIVIFEIPMAKIQRCKQECDNENQYHIK